MAAETQQHTLVSIIVEFFASQSIEHTKKIRLGKCLITRQGVRDKDTKRLIQIEMLIMMNISRNKARRERHYERTSLVRTVSHSHGTKEMLLCNLK